MNGNLKGGWNDERSQQGPTNLLQMEPCMWTHKHAHTYIRVYKTSHNAHNTSKETCTTSNNTPLIFTQTEHPKVAGFFHFALNLHFFILHIISISHCTSWLHYQLHEDMKFLAITKHRCEESWMVTALVCARQRLLGLSDFHLPAEGLSDTVKTPTGFLLV